MKLHFLVFIVVFLIGGCATTGDRSDHTHTHTLTHSHLEDFEDEDVDEEDEAEDEKDLEDEEKEEKVVVLVDVDEDQVAKIHAIGKTHKIEVKKVRRNYSYTSESGQLIPTALSMVELKFPKLSDKKFERKMAIHNHHPDLVYFLRKNDKGEFVLNLFATADVSYNLIVIWNSIYGNNASFERIILAKLTKGEEIRAKTSLDGFNYKQFIKSGGIFVTLGIERTEFIVFGKPSRVLVGDKALEQFARNGVLDYSISKKLFFNGFHQKTKDLPAHTKVEKPVIYSKKFDRVLAKYTELVDSFEAYLPFGVSFNRVQKDTNVTFRRNGSGGGDNNGGGQNDNIQNPNRRGNPNQGPGGGGRGGN